MRIDPANRYVTRELAQARCLAGPLGELYRSNPWLPEAFPNAGPPDPGLPGGGALQRALETPLRGRLGDAIERLATRLAHSRLRAHYGTGVPVEIAGALEAGGSLRFHGEHASEGLVGRYEARRAEVARLLERARETA
jgi:hypothetical protein